jgi:hypothetical protein
LGFCRVAVPAGLLSDLDGRSLGFLVNGNEPVVVRQWSDDAYGYWYLSFANVPSHGVLDPLYDVAVFLTFLLLTVIALVVLWKRKPVRSETFL